MASPYEFDANHGNDFVVLLLLLLLQDLCHVVMQFFGIKQFSTEIFLFYFSQFFSYHLP